VREPTERVHLLPVRRVLRAARAVGVLALALVLGTPASAQIAVEADDQPSFPIRAAFYYPWYPEAWDQHGISPYTNFHPSAGAYDGGDPTVIREHIDAMRYGHIDAGIASWWGPDTATDRRIPALLSGATGTPFRWGLYYELEGFGDPSVETLRHHLAVIRDRFASHASYLRVDGRFVVFAFADEADDCGMADRWDRANTVGAYVVLKVFDGYRDCGPQPDGWHQYAPSSPEEGHDHHSYSISPGFWKVGEAPRLDRSLDRWRSSIRRMVSSGARFQLVTTFNEWGEGTAVESAREWASASGYGAYLDALHADGGPQSPVSGSTPGPLPQPPERAAPLIAAAGDIACDPKAGRFNGLAGVDEACGMGRTAALLADRAPNAVLALGNTQYGEGRLREYRRSYHPTWGRARRITRPVPGNREYRTPDARGYFAYFGSAAGDPDRGYYSFDLGKWHLLALNSNCDDVGGCGQRSRQNRWLERDLARNRSVCTLAYWHHPRFSSGAHGSHREMDAVWRDLHRAGADVALSAHDHGYERFAPQGRDRSLDRRHGIRSFVVGTGGRKLRPYDSRSRHSVVRRAGAFGVLFLRLRPAGYDWAFRSAGGGRFADTGSGDCR
jgi:hypothetical protein